MASGGFTGALATTSIPDFLNRVQHEAAGRINVVPCVAVFTTDAHRKECATSARVNCDRAGTALAAEYESEACCTFSGGWRLFRERSEDSGVRVLVTEGVTGKSGGRFGAQAETAHCQLLLSGVEEGVLFVYEPFAESWDSVNDMRPKAVGALLRNKARSLTIKLVRGATADDGSCRERCLAFVTALAHDANAAVSDAVELGW